MKKRLISIALVLCMLLSGIPFTVFATEPTSVTFDAIAGTAGNAGESYDNVTDGCNSDISFSKWCVQKHTPATFVVIKASSAVVLSGYTFYTGNDTASNSGRNPKAWELYGCNDYTESDTTGESGSWVLITSVTDGKMSTTNFAENNYDVQTTTAYQYYKFIIKEIVSTQNNEPFQICGIKFSYNYSDDLGSKPVTVSLGDSAIADGDTENAKWDYVYFGEYNSNPIKWRVLSKNGSSTTRSGGTVDTATYKDSESKAYTGKALFMLSEFPLNVSAFSLNRSNAWEDSTLHDNMSSYFASGTGEEKYILKTTKETPVFDENHPQSYDIILFDNCSWQSYGDSMKDDTLFILSAREVETYLGKANANRIANDGSRSRSWWLRSQGPAPEHGWGVHEQDGGIFDRPIDAFLDVRPALNLNLSAVLFTTPAVGGKDVNAGLKAPAEYTGDEYKLTLLDETRAFAVTEKALTGYVGSGAEFTYTGAKTGDNEYISAMYVDGEGNILYYGQLEKVNSSGKAELKIPSNLEEGEYKVYIFNEQVNGDKKSDFASAFAEVTLTAKKKKTVTLGSAVIAGGDTENAKWDYVYFGEYNSNPIKWRVLSKNGSSTTRSDGTVDTATYKDSEGKAYTGKALFMLSEAVLNTAALSRVGFSAWERTTLHDNMSSYFASGTGEEKYILKTTKETPVLDRNNPVAYDTVKFDFCSCVSYGDSMKDDTLFILSAREVETYLGKARANREVKDNNNQPVHWWLRSQYSYDQYGFFVNGNNGDIQLKVIKDVLCVRPALNLNLSAVLFTTPAVGGKDVNAGLKAPKEYTGDEYKLTLLDETRAFAVTEKALTGYAGSGAEFTYTGAKTGDNEYISAMYVDGEGNILYYGQLEKVNSSGKAELKIPSNLAEGEYKVYIFNEQVNGDKKSDFASAFAEVTLTVEKEKTVTPTTVAKDITLGTSAIQDPTEVTTDREKYYTPNSYIYFGKNGTTPIKWRVLDADKTNDGTTAGMFLLSEYVLATGVQFNASTSSGNNYQGSDAQTWCSKFADNSLNFSTTEQKAMLGVAKTDSTEEVYDLPWGESSLTSADKAFFLSARELADYVGNNDRAPGLAVTDAAQVSARWWLRSPIADYTIYAGVVNHLGDVLSWRVDYNDGVRPALNLNLSAVLFTTGVLNTPLDTTKGLVKIEDYEGDEYKLTLYDEAHDGFTLVNSTAFGVSGCEGAVFNYTGAKTGENEYISAMILDGDGNILYYGQVGAVSESGAGSVTLNVPEGLAVGDYTVKLFNEQVNGAKESNLAGNFKTATLKVKNSHKVTLNVNGADSCTALTSYIEGVGATLPTPVKNGYSFGGWFESESFTGAAVMAIGTTETEDKVFYAKWNVINYVITYVLNGGTASNPTNYNIETETFTLNAPTRAGYSFTGWSGTGLSGNDNLNVEITRGSTGGRSYEAHYRDVTAPTGTVTVGENSWNTLLNTITFGLFFNKTQEVKITATDNSGEAVKIEYLLSDKALTGDELSKATFTEYKGKFNIDPNNEYVVYAKLTDSTGNTAYVNSNGIVLDNVVPVISGVEDGKTYCAAVEVTITEKYVDTVTVDDNSVTLNANGKFTLAPKATAQKIVVTDKAGNSTEITVTVNNGHTGGKATCTKQAECSVCGTLYGDVDKTNHAGGTELKNDKAATCTEDGYTGDTHCKGCGDKLSSGKPITKLGHVDKNKDHICDREACKAVISACSGGTANCHKKAVCEWCGNEYGDVDKTNHDGEKVFKSINENTHEKVWNCCGKVVETGISHSFNGDGVCEDCGYGLPMFTVTYTDGFDGKAFMDEAHTVPKGFATPAPTVSTKNYNGYSFMGWNKTIAATVTSDVTYTAVWADVTAPTGTVTVGENSWNTLLNTITFGLFFNKTQEVKITATDNSGEAVKIEYLLSDKALTGDELSKATFTEYKGKFNIDPNNEYVVYAKLTDSTGNTAYVNSNGIVLDNVVPVISGVEDGKTYCAAVEVTITEKYVDTVTVDDNSVTLNANGKFTLAPKATAQKIVVTDKAGNSTEIIVTVNNGHTGGKATCTKQAECSVCKTPYGDIDKTNHTGEKEWSVKTNSEHEQRWSCCGDVTVKKAAHDFGTDNICDTCGYGCSHEDDDKNHVCELCGVTISEHKGGKATCHEKAVCTYCGNKYGNVDKTNHAGGTELRNDKAATCTEDGYTGDTYCKGCGDKLDTGKPITKSGHEDKNKDHICDREACEAVISTCSGGKATCHEKAVCTYCGNKYGDVDKTNHAGGTELRNDKAATCTEDGYTGDTHCKGCGDKLDTGKPITKLGHEDKNKDHICDREACEAVISTCSGGKATCHEKAVCEWCGNEYGDVDKTNHAGGTELRNDKAATCTEDGYTGDTHCKGCGDKLDTGKPITKLGHEDEDSNHKCDRCDETVSECADGDKDHKCDVCGETVSECADGDKDHKCDVCGETVSECEDGDKDHKCDVCGETVSECEDGDKDHKCDVCGETVSECEDGDKDHKCDVCGETVSECEDGDKNHKCDVCGEVMSEHEGGEANCREKAVCDICGGAYGETDPDTHGNLEHKKAQKATTEKEGNIEYWHCKDCDKYFSDKECKNEITLAETVIAKKAPDNAAETGDEFSAAIFSMLALVSASWLVLVEIQRKKRDKSRVN